MLVNLWNNPNKPNADIKNKSKLIFRIESILLLIYFSFICKLIKSILLLMGNLVSLYLVKTDLNWFKYNIDKYIINKSVFTLVAAIALIYIYNLY